MAVTAKVLGQLDNAVATEETLYTVPGATSATVSTLIVCNRGAATTFRVAIDVGGSGVADKDYLYYDVPIAVNDTFAATIGITLAATDLVRVESASGDTSMSLFGIEEA